MMETTPKPRKTTPLAALIRTNPQTTRKNATRRLSPERGTYRATKKIKRAIEEIKGTTGKTAAHLLTTQVTKRGILTMTSKKNKINIKVKITESQTISIKITTQKIHIKININKYCPNQSKKD